MGFMLNRAVLLVVIVVASLIMSGCSTFQYFGLRVDNDGIHVQGPIRLPKDECHLDKSSACRTDGKKVSD